MSDTVNEGGASNAPSTPNVSEPIGTPSVSATPRSLDIDSLLNAHLPAPPEGQKGHSISPEELAALPDPLQKMAANLRDDYRRKTEALAAKEREYNSVQSGWLSAQEQELRSKLDIPDDLDPYSVDGLQKLIDKKVAEAMLAMQAPIRETNAKAARTAELESFKAQHPDIPEYIGRIAELVKTQGIKPDVAYWIAKGETADRLQAEAAKVAFEAKQKEAQASAAAVRNTVSGHAVPPGSVSTRPKFKSAVEAYNYFQNGGK